MVGYGTTNIVSILGGGGSGGPTKLFIESRLSAEPKKGDKVLVQADYSSNGILWEYTKNTSSSVYSGAVDISGDHICGGTEGGLRWNNETKQYDQISSTSISNSLHTVLSRFINNNTIAIRTENNSGFTPVTYVSLNNLTRYSSDLVVVDEQFYFSGGNLCKFGSTDQYKITSFNNRAQFKKFGNNIYIHGGSSFIFVVDVTNFPNCIEISIPKPAGESSSSDLNLIGDTELRYVVFGRNPVTIYKYVDGGFVTDRAVSAAYDGLSKFFINDNIGDIGGIGANSIIYLRYDPTTQAFKDIIAPSAFENKVVEMINTATKVNDGAIIQATPDLSTWYASFKTDSVYHVVVYRVGDGTLYLTDNNYYNYNTATTFTGIITGNKDSEGRYEVETWLGEESNIAVQTSVDADIDIKKVD